MYHNLVSKFINVALQRSAFKDACQEEKLGVEGWMITWKVSRKGIISLKA